MGALFTSNKVSGGEHVEEQTTEASSNRKKGLQKFRLIMVGQLLLGGGLLACGIYAIQLFEPNAFFGPPYFIGAMVVGPMFLFGGLAAFMLQRHAARYEESDQAKQLTQCDMVGVLVTTVFTFVGCFMGFAMLGISGVFSNGNDCFSCEEDPHKELNKTLATAICAMLAAAVLLLVINIYVLVTTMGSFCATTQNRPTTRLQQRQILVTQMALNQPTTSRQQHMENPDAAGLFAPNPMAAYPPMVTPTAPPLFGNASAHRKQGMSDLQRQNQLLQQQIQLMQQQQQHQQQQQYGFGPPPQPPSYESVVGFR